MSALFKKCVKAVEDLRYWSILDKKINEEFAASVYNVMKTEIDKLEKENDRIVNLVEQLYESGVYNCETEKTIRDILKLKNY